MMRIAFLLLSLLLAACDRLDMYDQPKIKPLAESDFFEDRRGARPLVEGTVARGHLNADDRLYTGKVEGKLSATFPFTMARADLERGRERYDIFCSACHDRAGEGNGIVVQRGFPRPPSLHSTRLREIPPGHLFDVITHGFGQMPAYAVQVETKDRWRIAAYLRALQLSQHATLDAVPGDKKALLTRGGRP